MKYTLVEFSDGTFLVPTYLYYLMIIGFPVAISVGIIAIFYVGGNI